MSKVADRLASAGFELPDAPKAVGDYVPARVAGDLVFTSGQLPMRAGALITTGQVPDVVSPDAAKRCAAQCALNALAAASTVCDLDRVVAVVKLVGYVASDPSYTAQPHVINGGSEVVLAAYGDAGKHAREAVGVAALPLGAPVELSLLLQLALDD